MKIFGKKKKDFVDLTEHYKKKQQQVADMKTELQEEKKNSQTENKYSGFFGGFFDNPAVVPKTEDSSTQVFGETVNPEERRRKLAKRLQSITEKMEDLSNQIYHLQQRLEVVERKLDVGKGY